MSTMKFDYYHISESEQFTFYRIPKALFTEDHFKKMSSDAKVLYGLMLDRMALSAKNGWCDKHDRVYIIFTLEEATECMNCSSDKGVKIFKELDESGLIERKKQGQGHPSWIFVKNFTTARNEESDTRNQDFRKTEVKSSENQKSRLQKNRSADFRKSECSNTDINKTDYSDISINQSSVVTDEKIADEIDEKEYREIIRENIEYDILAERYGGSYADEIYDLIVDTVTSPSQVIRIGKTDLSKEAVKERFLKLDSSHIEYVLRCMKQNTVKVRNIRSYLLTSLYSAPTTMSSYYASEVAGLFQEGQK